MLKIACIALALALPASLIPAALWSNVTEAQEAKTKAKARITLRTRRAYPCPCKES